MITEVKLSDFAKPINETVSEVDVFGLFSAVNQMYAQTMKKSK